jgi:hypothetical protein
LPPREKGEYLSDRLADEAILFLRREKDKPLFVCLSTYNPNYPFEAPSELVTHYQGKEGPGLKNPVYGGQIEAADRTAGRVLDELDREQTDISDIIQQLHQVVDETIETKSDRIGEASEPYDICKIDFARLKQEFERSPAKRVGSTDRNATHGCRPCCVCRHHHANVPTAARACQRTSGL